MNPIITPTTPHTPPFAHPGDFYQVRDFGQKWEATAQLLRWQGRPLLLALLYYAAPWLLLGNVLQAVTTAQTYSTGDATSWLQWAGMAIERLGELVGTAVVYGFLSLRLNMHQAPGYQLTAADIWRATRGTGLYLGRWLSMALLVVAGFFLLIAPSVYVAVVMALLPGVVFLENDGLTRTFELIKDHWWPTAALVLVAQLISLALLAAPSAIGTFLLRAVMFDEDNTLTIWALALGMQLFGALAAFVMLPVRNVLLAFQYFGIVEAKEHLGLEWRAARLGQEAPAPLPNADHLYAATDEVRL